ncbi:putative transporter [Paramagnetospirillum magnetotacticum MS-1]|uniref:Putative transporter n=1 Tax=Paramagnetospirillum magnetotacticum MS-1 TaxID=272627 RepID=A0A0C2YY18_PARME|nr:SLC13 family permease [Paramagnetospirillum magnetotacticum]KIL99993.1 putative transporter [Paramagnetospirillum magnetotacticum MS-1]
MTLEQGLAFTILGATIVMFALDKLRYDLVALLSLSAGILVGLVPPDRAFHGFSDPVVVVVAAALVVSAGIERSGIIELLMKPLSALKSPDALICALVALVMVLSAFMKNIGALAIFIPLSIRLARSSGIPVSQILMPLSFASLLGGVMTLIGTSPNIIVSRVRMDLTGKAFTMFDFTPVGLGICLAGIGFLTFAWRVLPRDRQGSSSGKGFRIEDYLAEVRIEAHSPLIGATVTDLEQLFSGGAVTVAAIIRDQGHRYVPGGHWEFSQSDVLVLEGDPMALKPLLDSAGLVLMGGGGLGGEDTTVMEAVVMPNSALVGSTAAKSAMRRRYGIALLAISRGGRHMIERLRQTEFMAGDVLVVEGNGEAMPGTLAQLGCLPLGQKAMPIARKRAWLPVGIAFAAMMSVAVGVMPVAPAFFLAAVAMVLSGCLPLRDAYEAIHWPIIILLGALIPISDSMKSTGASDLLAGWLALAAAQVPVPMALGLVLLASMLLAPFLHHAATVLLMGPVAAGMAVKMGLAVDPFLMAVALGAASDFLTPIGHQCNTLVMGVGGYRFGDYWRLGLPLSVIVLVSGTLLILTFWPI